MNNPLPTFFLLSMTGLAAAYAMTMRSRVVDLQDDLSTARAAVETSTKACRSLEAEIAVRDRIISLRDERLADVERRASLAHERLEEVSGREEVRVWADAGLPDDVVRLLKAGNGDHRAGGADSSSDDADAACSGAGHGREDKQGSGRVGAGTEGSAGTGERTAGSAQGVVR